MGCFLIASGKTVIGYSQVLLPAAVMSFLGHKAVPHPYGQCECAACSQWQTEWLRSSRAVRIIAYRPTALTKPSIERGCAEGLDLAGGTGGYWGYKKCRHARTENGVP